MEQSASQALLQIWRLGEDRHNTPGCPFRYRLVTNLPGGVTLLPNENYPTPLAAETAARLVATVTSIHIVRVLPVEDEDYGCMPVEKISAVYLENSKAVDEFQGREPVFYNAHYWRRHPA